MALSLETQSGERRGLHSKGSQYYSGAPSARTCHGRGAYWWAQIEEDCPISLIPIKELPQPPFELIAPGSAVVHYFDAGYLADFVLRTADFINPVNRQPLTRIECVSLDAHLRRHHPSKPTPSVADAFDLFQSKCSDGNPVRREATAVLQHLFTFSRRPFHSASGPRPQGSGSAARNTRRERAAHEELPDLSGQAFPGLEPPSLRMASMRRSQAEVVQGSMRASRRASRARDSPTTQSAALSLAEHTPAGADNQVQERTETECELDHVPMHLQCKQASHTCAAEGASFLKPVPDEEFVGADPEDRDAAIEAELEVLRSIYGDSAVVSDRSAIFGPRGWSCWGITVTSGPWQLQVVISSDCPYPQACPLLRASLRNQRLADPELGRAAEALGAAARNGAGDAFIFSLVEALREVDE